MILCRELLEFHRDQSDGALLGSNSGGEGQLFRLNRRLQMFGSAVCLVTTLAACATTQNNVTFYSNPKGVQFASSATVPWSSDELAACRSIQMIQAGRAEAPIFGCTENLSGTEAAFELQRALVEAVVGVQVSPNVFRQARMLGYIEFGAVIGPFPDDFDPASLFAVPTAMFDSGEGNVQPYLRPVAYPYEASGFEIEASCRIAVNVLPDGTSQDACAACSTQGAGALPGWTDESVELFETSLEYDSQFWRYVPFESEDSQASYVRVDYVLAGNSADALIFELPENHRCHSRLEKFFMDEIASATDGPEESLPVVAEE